MQIPPGSANALQPGCNVYTVTENVVAIGDDVAEIDADAESDAPVFGHFDFAVHHRPLDLDGAAHRIHDAREFHEQAVAGRLHDAAVVLLDFRIDELAAMRLEAFERPFLIHSHQARVSRHIGGEDRGETAGRGHRGEPPGDVRDQAAQIDATGPGPTKRSNCDYRTETSFIFIDNKGLLCYHCRQMHLVTGTLKLFSTATAFRDYTWSRFGPNWHAVIARSALRDEAISTRRALRGPRLLRSARNDDPEFAVQSERNPL
jgi:hypothetical protein